MTCRDLVRCVVALLVVAPTLLFAHSQYEELIDLLTTSNVARITFTNYGNTAIVEMGTNAPPRDFQLYAARTEDPLFLRFLAERRIAYTVATNSPATDNGSLAWIVLAWVAMTVPVGIFLMLGKISSTLDKMLRVFSQTDKRQG